MNGEIYQRMVELHAYAEALQRDLPNLSSGKSYVDEWVIRYLGGVTAAAETLEPSRELEAGIYALARLAIDDLPDDQELSKRISKLSGLCQALKRAERRLSKNAL
jgi:hypothetical protein